MTLRNMLFWRTFALIALVVALVSSTLFYFQHLSYHMVAQREAEAHAVFLAGQCIRPMLWDDRLQLQYLFSSTVEKKVAAYVWLERDGIPLAHTFAQGVPKSLLDLHPPGGGETSVLTWQDQNGRVFLDIAAPLPRPVSGVLHMGIAEDTADKGVVNKLTITSAIALLALALGAALARLMANAITKATQAATQALTASELKYRTLADNTADWEFWIDPDEQPIYNSPSCERILGHTPDELAADPSLFFRTIHPDDQRRFAAHRHSACLSKTGDEMELRIVRKDGEIRWISHRCRPVFGQEDEYLGTRGSNTDITERKVKEAALQRTRTEIDRLSQRNRLLLDAAGEGIYGVEHAGRIIFINPAALTMLGLTEEEAMGKNAHALFHYQKPDGSDYPETDCPLHLTLLDAVRREVDEHFIRKNGQPFPVHLVATPMQDDARMEGAEVVFRDITAQKAMEAELTRLATTDPLTEVANRRHFLEQVEMELARMQRFQEPAALLMLDLDHFKRINDGYGHAAGDAVLTAFAATLRETLRKIDLVGRLGGEEFAVLLPGAEAEAAHQFAERLRERVAEMVVEIDDPQGNRQLTVTVSIGIARLEPGDERPDAPLARADEALYRAKAGGRNRVEISA